MTLTQALQELEQLGTEQTKKTYRRHGAGEDLYGVKFGDLGKLKKKIKTDHPLAVELWESGNYDARNLATMIADPAQATEEMLEGWAGGLRNYALSDLLAGFAARTAPAVTLMERWTDSDDEWKGRTGWLMLAHIAKDTMGHGELADGYFERYLDIIERDIHTRKNRVRDAMNSALIGIGMRNEHLRERAFTVAAKIGKVEVDHGDTNCTTPDAAEYLRKAVAHQEKKQAKN